MQYPHVMKIQAQYVATISASYRIVPGTNGCEVVPELSHASTIVQLNKAARPDHDEASMTL